MFIESAKAERRGSRLTRLLTAQPHDPSSASNCRKRRWPKGGASRSKFLNPSWKLSSFYLGPMVPQGQSSSRLRCPSFRALILASHDPIFRPLWCCDTTTEAPTPVMFGEIDGGVATAFHVFIESAKAERRWSRLTRLLTAQPHDPSSASNCRNQRWPG